MEYLPNEVNDIIKNYTIFKPKTNKKLKKAVNLWCKNKDAALNKYGHISLWDTSLITDMVNLFVDKEDFNENINNWDVSNVTTMFGLFYNAKSFNQPLNNWDVSNVKDMNAVFV